jgi:hypothetical protein
LNYVPLPVVVVVAEPHLEVVDIVDTVVVAADLAVQHGVDSTHQRNTVLDDS